MEQKKYDVVIIGAGGSGLTAAIYTSRAELKTVVLEKNAPGGQIAITDVVENFPGFPEGIAGPDIGIKMEEQAKRCGAHIVYTEVQQITKKNADFVVVTDEGEFLTHSVILANGARYRRLDVPGESTFTGRGVSYCATCDGPFFKNKTIAVVGGGDSALQEGLFLTTFAQKVYIIHRRDTLRAGILLQKRAHDNSKIQFVFDNVVTEIKGAATLQSIIVKNVKTNTTQELLVQGVFIFVGHEPSSLLLRDLVVLDDHGYVVTDDSLHTSVPGIFACGEVRQGATRQLIAACGEGCRAGLGVQHYLENQSV
jgi:thioredoxin reductase (NADPH)